MFEVELSSSMYMCDEGSEFVTIVITKPFTPTDVDVIIVLRDGSALGT